MTEICVQIDGKLKDIKEAILSKGFKFIETYENFDTYFTTINEKEINDTPYKNLLDNSIIIRNILGDNCDIKNIVYKKKTLDDKGNVIQEIKTKLKIDDTTKAKLIFQNLRMACWCDYVIQNNEYKKDDITINIQYTKELGCFIEIEEFKSIENKTNEKKFEILISIINSLGFPIGTDYSCKKPYMFLTKNKH